MKNHSKGRAGLLALAAAACLAGAPAHAQSGKPLHLIVITAAGGAADQTARLVGEQLGPALGRPVLVENKPGAGGNIASQFVARAQPDGDTLLVTSNNHTINTSLYSKPGYSTDDFVPVVQIARGPSVIVVHPESKFKTVAQFIDEAKGTPISYGSIGVGSGAHLVAECLKATTGAQLDHIPYKGGAPAVADAVGGHVPAVFTTLASAGVYVRASKLRGLSVSSAQRSGTLPDIPTLAESGYGDCTYDTWLGIVGPKGMPAEVVDKLNREISAILKSDKAREVIQTLGYEPVGEPAGKFGEMLRADADKTSRLIKQAGLTAE